MLHDPQFRTRFDREAKTIAMLEHPAIVPVYDFGEEDGQPYFVMRYMTGGSLAERMRSGPLPVQEVARLMARLAPALDDAHAKGIIHRDLKPGNILFDQFNEPYVSDFGIAKFSESQTNVTGSAIVGTPAYMSPEQAQGVSIDGRSDIYGLGVILFEMLTGRQPYEGDTPMSVVVKQITEPVPHILDVKPDLPHAIEQVIEKAMCKDRDGRFSTVKSLADALNAVAQGATPDLVGSNKTVMAPPKTVMASNTMVPAKTAIGKRVGPPAGGEQVPQAPNAVAPRKRGVACIGAAAVILFILIAAGVTGVIVFRDKIPLLAGLARPQPTATVLPPTWTAVIDTPIIVNSPVPSNTPLPTLTLTPTLPPQTVIGGADLIAFLNGNNIWVMKPDGSDLRQLTTDGAEKHNLQWSPDGQTIFYISGLCINSVTLAGEDSVTLTCFNSSQMVEAFEISPDGKQVAVSVDRALFVVPFDLTALAKARSWSGLQAMKGCVTYNTASNQAPAKNVLWSSNGNKLAIKTVGVANGTRADIIRIFDISLCDSTKMTQLDEFPSDRFSITGVSIPNFDWDGDTVFVLNDAYLGEFGYMYNYNSRSLLSKKLDPMNTTCCYNGISWSPDRNYMLFLYQDIHGGGNAKSSLYYVPYGTIGTGTKYTPLSLPDGFFSNIKSHFEAILRAANP
jgi:serine/threonine-protein kinase